MTVEARAQFGVALIPFERLRSRERPMHQCRLEITKSGQSTNLVMGTGKFHFWRLVTPVAWWTGATAGYWTRRTNSTKFRSFSYLELLGPTGNSVARLPEQPYKMADKFQGTLITRSWIFETDGESFDVTVKESAPTRKKFRLWESWGGSLSYTVLQSEVVGFEIMDQTTNLSALYLYKGVGLSIGLPIPKVPNTVPSASFKGPPNDFEAPGWMLAEDFEGDATLQAGNVGLGTPYSKNCFEFAGHVDNFPGFWGRIPDLQTGRTLGLPSAGFSSGSMRLVRGAQGRSP